ncbi:Sporulation kinase D [bacterium HR33]|nr:Sporulation kinase D [bacterium HR33]
MGFWLGRPSVWLAAAGLALSVWAGLWTARRRTWRAIPSLAVAAAAGWVALTTAAGVRKVESDWLAVREELIEQARVELDRQLSGAVALARSLAERAVLEASDGSPASFRKLERLLRDDQPEHGVAVFDLRGEPLSWAGRHRISPDLRTRELFAAITPFYAVLRARRQSEGRIAVGEVLLAADSAVPDRDGSLAARFVRATGVGLEFLPPGGGAAASTDVFDYCIPSCRPAGIAPDTLFSVRVVPPTQGQRKMSLLESGSGWVSLWTVVLLGLLAATATRPVRYAAVAGLGLLLLFTRAGEAIGLEAAFSPAWYYWEALGPFGSSAGALLASGALAVVFAVGLWDFGLRLGTLFRLAGWSIAAVAVFWLAALVRGITPPAGGVSVGLWVAWQTAVAIPTAALLFVAAALAGSARNQASGKGALAAIFWASALAIVGLLLWRPGRPWPLWYLALWVPAFVLVVGSGTRLRLAVVAAWVSGVAAALFTWSAAVEGRLMLASRDAERLGTAPDPVAAGLLEHFAASLGEQPVPRSAAALYRAWQRTQLARDGYPAVLVTWSASGEPEARLELAELDLPAPLLAAIARAARDEEQFSVDAVNRVPGVHYVLSVPYPDGSVVTVGLGPLSRAVPAVRLARFLRGEQVSAQPYEFAIGEPFAGEAGEEIGRWRRYGWEVRGDRVLELPGGSRHLHMRVGLGNPVQLLVRGTLAGLLDVLLVALLWLCGELLARSADLKAMFGRIGRPRSYRARLTVALAAFFVIPTVGFAVWSAARLESEAERSARLLARQTLRDAAAAWGNLHALDPRAPAQLGELALRHGADLVLYRGGLLAGSSVPVLEQLGLLDLFMPFPVYRSLFLEDELEAAERSAIAGRRTLVGYRKLGMAAGGAAVMAAPRLVDDVELVRELEDLAYSLVLATAAGLGLAVWLAGLAARWLARPVHALRGAAEAIGRGVSMPVLGPEVPVEFVPVVEGLERMAEDVRAGQAALEAARQRTAAVLRSVATGVVALDADMRVTLANPRAEELLGVVLPEGASISDRTGPRWRELWWRVAEFLRRGKEEPEAHELVVGERRIRALVASLGDRSGCVVALDDTTELTHAVRVLAWGELARQIAHEIKNPLTPIRLGVQHLERAYRDRRRDFGATLEKTAGQILAEIERLDAIARAFSRFGAPPAEAGPLERQDIVEIVREAVQLYALGGARVRVSAPGSVFAVTRRDELKEVVLNLVENSRNAGAGEIVVEIEQRAGGGACLRVRDDGCGIAPEDLPRIFEPQFSTTTSGTGLGLAICRRLVRSWGGTIEVESELGKGTVVKLELPG